MEENLQHLFSRFCSGDTKAFAQLYHQLKTPVYTICYRILGSREAAEDVTHDVFVKLYQSPPAKPVQNPRAWVFQVAHNLAIDALRRQSRWVSGAVDIWEDAITERVDTRLDLQQALVQLSQQERALLALRLNGGLHFREVATILGKSLPATYRMYQAAMRRLRDTMNGGE